MRLALLSAASSVHTVKIANGLAGLGHQVLLYSLPNHPDRDGALAPQVTVRYFPIGGGRGYFQNSKTLRRWLKEDGAEVLCAHYATGYGFLAGLCRFHPYVLSVWGSDVYEFPYKSPLHRFLLCHNLKKPDLLLSTSHVMAKQTELFVKNKKIIVTPFGVDVSIFSPAEQPQEKPVVGFVKAVSEIYGIRYLIHAFAQVQAQFDAQLRVYGDGDQLEEMKELAASLGIADSVTFYGRIPHNQVADAMRGCSVICVPSPESESFGVAAVEAMACGVPCITSDADGLSEVMVDGETGFVVPRRDVDALADKLRILLDDATRRKKMGKMGRRRVEEHYDWEKNLKVIEQAYILV